MTAVKLSAIADEIQAAAEAERTIRRIWVHPLALRGSPVHLDRDVHIHPDDWHALGLPLGTSQLYGFHVHHQERD